ncbi:MAG: hypothetical protein LUC87_08320 [Clostridiales bacterium]|nr:hypothetical protein [Clostridiales bacterium]
MDTINTLLLQRQYKQYRISLGNMEAINRKYHDLKHQIGVIRLRLDAARQRFSVPRMAATAKNGCQAGVFIYEHDSREGG